MEQSWNKVRNYLGSPKFDIPILKMEKLRYLAIFLKYNGEQESQDRNPSFQTLRLPVQCSFYMRKERVYEVMEKRSTSSQSICVAQ